MNYLVDDQDSYIQIGLNTPPISEKIENLINKAKQVFSYSMVKEMTNSDSIPEEFYREFSVELPKGYIALYCHEEDQNGEILKHLCVTSKYQGEVPPPEIFEEIMRAFKFKNSLATCISRGTVWDSEVQNRKVAINVVEPLDGEFDRYLKKVFF